MDELIKRLRDFSSLLRESDTLTRYNCFDAEADDIDAVIARNKAMEVDIAENDALIDTLRDRIAALEAQIAAAEKQEPVAYLRDVAQLSDWLLTDPQTTEKLHFAGPLESDFRNLQRVRMESKSGNVWTLIAGLEEGYLSTSERMDNLFAAVGEESKREDRRVKNLIDACEGELDGIVVTDAQARAILDYVDMDGLAGLADKESK